ncbi:hypothetical protein ACF08N_33675 [Streptomyces sp. NPDC015127]|uniref:hypothetical protein n=1 Tax=Streptomyces sp. NPDC015127 TaxID=3364939 RepID=UPI0037019CB6
MTRMKKYVTAAAVAAALVGAPTMAHAIATANTPASMAGIQTAAAAKASSSASVRVVAPGERIAAAPKVQLWLTKDGKHWSTPTMTNQFRSVTDGNIDMSRPGVSLQAEPVEGRYFLSGVYNGKGDAATVKVKTEQGTVTGTIVRLAGKPGWGAWYATSKLPNGPKSKDGKRSFVHSVTVYDAAGRTIAKMTSPSFG